MRPELRSNLFVITPVLLIAITASVFLVNDLSTQRQVRRGHLIGKLSRFSRRVRYKPKGAFIWQDAQIGQPLFKGDILTTGPESTALIESGDGQNIQLQPGTSVVLDDPKDLRSQKVNGSVLIHGENGNEIFLGTGEVFSFPVHLIFPEELSDVFISGIPGATQTVTFSWKQIAQTAESVAFLQIAKNHLFDGSDTYEYRIPSGANQLDLSVPLGTRYWRIVDAAKKPLSTYRQFNAVKVLPLQAEAPRGAVTIWDNTVNFRWASLPENPTQLGSHWIEVSSLPNFSSLIQKKSVPGLAQLSSVDGIPVGKFFWRMTSRYGNLTIPSAPQEVIVEKGHQLTIFPQSPRDHAVAYLLTEIEFRWDSNSSKADYTFELIGTDGVEVKKIDTTNPFVSISDLAPGKYRWRVLSQLRKLRAESPWREISVLKPGNLQLLRPKSGEELDVTSEGAPITFEWLRPEPERGAEYLFEISTDPEFKSVIGFKKSKSTKTTSAEFNLTPRRDYFWRVTLLNPDNSGVVTSPASSFKYSIFTELVAPSNLLPQAGVTCNPLKNKHFCNFSWTTVPGATQYEIEFFKAGPTGRMPSSMDNTKPALRRTVFESSFQLKSLEEGLYFWRVRGLDDKKHRGTSSALQVFRFTLGTVLYAPRNRSSEVQ